MEQQERRGSRSSNGKSRQEDDRNHRQGKLRPYTDCLNTATVTMVLIFQKDEDDPILADAVIIDEMSMVDVLLMNHLLKAIIPGTRLVLVGDVDQLPSVGPGNVLKDIISSGIIKVVRLTEIFRQAQESMIVLNAHRINQGHMPYLNVKGGDFFFDKKENPEVILDTIFDLICRRLPNFGNYDPMRDIQVLVPMRKVLSG